MTRIRGEDGRYSSDEDLSAEVARLTTENAALKAKLFGVRAISLMPHKVVINTLAQWRDLLNQQDRDRPQGELPDFKQFMKDTDDAKF